jgi:hypothetical protein
MTYLSSVSRPAPVTGMPSPSMPGLNLSKDCWQRWDQALPQQAGALDTSIFQPQLTGIVTHFTKHSPDGKIIHLIRQGLFDWF